jgi:hypothetical protein
LLLGLNKKRQALNLIFETSQQKQPLKSISLLLLILMLNICLTTAQNYLDMVQVFYSNTPLNQFDSSLNKTRVQDFTFNSTLPIKLTDKTALITGLDVEWMYAGLTPTGSSGSAAGIILKLGVNHKLNEKWTTNFVLLPRLASDFKKPGGGLSREDFQIGGLWMFKYAPRQNLKYKLALYYNSELFGPFVSPILGLYYKSRNNKFESDLSLPFFVDANYRIRPSVFTGVKFQAFVRTFNLHDPYYKGNGEYLAKTSNELYAYLGFEPVKGILLKANIGYSVARNYRLYDIHDKVAFGLSAFRFGDNRKQLNADFADGILFRVDCVYRFYTK